MSHDNPKWTGDLEPADDPCFLAIVERLVERLAAGEIADVRMVRIDNWFGAKWLGFAGKMLGALSVHKDTTRADLVVPPFTPGRVVWEHHFSRDGAGKYLLRHGEPILHRTQTTSSNLSRKLADISPQTHFVWFSGNSGKNGRGGILGASLHERDQDAYYLGFTRKQAWQVGDVAGGPPVLPDSLLIDARGH